jgi:hypothetical protein
MGTRSITYIYDENGKVICKMYVQFDGYPSGHGLDLARFLKENLNLRNMGWLATKLTAHFYKMHNESMHLISPDNKMYACEEYVYHVYHDHVSVQSLNDDREEESSWEEFENVCNEFEEEE